MKRFLKFFIISIITSGLILTLAYLFSFTPLDPHNGSLFSNGFITGMVLFWVGIFRIRPSQNLGNRARSIESTMYGGVRDNFKNKNYIPKKLLNEHNSDAIGLLLAGIINLILSFLF